MAPAELEDLLLGCDGVADAAVVGISHPQDGEVPKAFVVKKAGARLSEEDVKAFVKGTADKEMRTRVWRVAKGSQKPPKVENRRDPKYHEN